MPRFITNLWFDTEAHDAAEYYCSVFPNSARAFTAMLTMGKIDIAAVRAAADS